MSNGGPSLTFPSQRIARDRVHREILLAAAAALDDPGRWSFEKSALLRELNLSGIAEAVRWLDVKAILEGWSVLPDGAGGVLYVPRPYRGELIPVLEGFFRKFETSTSYVPILDADGSPVRDAEGHELLRKVVTKRGTERDKRAVPQRYVAGMAGSKKTAGFCSVKFANGAYARVALAKAALEAGAATARARTLVRHVESSGIEAGPQPPALT